ncbi:MAG: hypothetical protein IJ493_07680 [Clostridia bacterium]|nr:hypothetical protein [Clostridia bacterium]
MKRFVCALLTLFLLTLSACGSDNPDYECTLTTYSQESGDSFIEIAYPVLTGDAVSGSLEEKIRGYVVDYMEQYLRYANAEGAYSYVIDDVTVTCRLPGLVSVLCAGSFTDADSSYPETIVYTLNINPESAVIYNEFDDFIADFDALADTFRSGGFTLESGVNDLLTKTNYTDMFIAYSDLYGIYPPLYVIDSGDGLRLGLSVELVYTLGGHAEFSIPLDEIDGAITDTLRSLIK